MMKKTLLLIILTWRLGSQASLAQTRHAFHDDVETIKAYDKLYAPPEHPILFVGSSSIRKWGDLQQAFGTYGVINRGVGGTVIDDIDYYLDDIVFPYQPRQIVLYVGENDVPNEKLTADSILKKTIHLYRDIRAKMPEVPIVYISFKPSPSRDRFQEKASAANRLIRQFLSHEPKTVFVDIHRLMLTRDGKSRPELFVSDMLHMNLQGYAIWNKAIKPYLLKNEKE